MTNVGWRKTQTCTSFSGIMLAAINVRRDVVRKQLMLVKPHLARLRRDGTKTDGNYNFHSNIITVWSLSSLYFWKVDNTNDHSWVQ